MNAFNLMDMYIENQEKNENMRSQGQERLRPLPSATSLVEKNRKDNDIAKDDNTTLIRGCPPHFACALARPASPTITPLPRLWSCS